MIIGKFPNLRLRRTRKYTWSRKLIQENNLSPNDLIHPIFLIEGKNKKQAVKSMPGVYRYSIDHLGVIINNIIKHKIPMVALFPSTPNNKKDNFGTEAFNEDNLVCRAIRYIKKRSLKKFCFYLVWKHLHTNFDSFCQLNRKASQLLQHLSWLQPSLLDLLLLLLLNLLKLHHTQSPLLLPHLKRIQFQHRQ